MRLNESENASHGYRLREQENLNESLVFHFCRACSKRKLKEEEQPLSTHINFVGKEAFCSCNMAEIENHSLVNELLQDEEVESVIGEDVHRSVDGGIENEDRDPVLTVENNTSRRSPDVVLDQSPRISRPRKRLQTP